MLEPVAPVGAEAAVTLLLLPGEADRPAPLACFESVGPRGGGEWGCRSLDHIWMRPCSTNIQQHLQ